MDRYRIGFISGYQGQFDYSVFDTETQQTYRLSYRIALNDYLERWYNGTPEKYQRDIVGSLYLVCCWECRDPALVEAFREYMQKEWDDYLVYCEKKREKFADDPEMAAIYTAGPASPLILGGAYWDDGWIRIDPDHCLKCGVHFDDGSCVVDEEMIL